MDNPDTFETLIKRCWQGTIRKFVELKHVSNGNQNKRGQGYQARSKPFPVTIAAQTEEERAAEKNEEYKITRRVACWTMITGIGTILGVAVAGVAAYIFGQQLGAAQNQLIEQRAEFHLDRQPFVGIDEKEITINKPLTFDADGARINFDLWFHNTGKSAAINTSSLARELSIAPLVEFPIPPQGPAAQLSGAINCNKGIASIFTSMGTIILPGAGSKYNLDKTIKRETFRLDSNGMVSAWFPLCIVYKDDGGRVHGTGFILFLETDDGKQSFAPTGTIKGQFKILSAGESVF